MKKLTIDKLPTDTELCKLLLERQTFGWNWWTKKFENDSNCLEFKPEKKICCDEELQTSVFSKAGHLYTIQGFSTMDVRIYCSTCKKCGISTHLDGREYGLLNFGNLYLIDVGKCCMLI